MDDDWLENLRRTAYHDLFQATWGGWDEARHQRHFAACLDRGRISIIEVDGFRVGMIQFFDGPNAIEVGEIQVQPRDQNKGIGTIVLLDVIAMAHRYGKHVSLHVGLKNDRALRLYLRLAFNKSAKQKPTTR